MARVSLRRARNLYVTDQIQTGPPARFRWARVSKIRSLSYAMIRKKIGPARFTNSHHHGLRRFRSKGAICLAGLPSRPCAGQGRGESGRCFRPATKPVGRGGARGKREQKEGTPSISRLVLGHQRVRGSYLLALVVAFRTR